LNAPDGKDAATREPTGARHGAGGRFPFTGLQHERQERTVMKRVTLVKLLVSDHDEALEFYTKKLGFEVAEDTTMGDYRWLLVRLPGNEEFCLNLDIARTGEQKALVGRQAADLPLFSIETDDCLSEYWALKKRGVEFDGEPEVRSYGTGVLMKDLYGNKIYLNQD
jgi:catechol 2,3-dioxygenase-like lactoylglutathione lyase family enzyme